MTAPTSNATNGQRPVESGLLLSISHPACTSAVTGVATAVHIVKGMKRAYLTVYDYRMGGLWAYVVARSPDEITSTYPELTVFEEPPNWMSEAERADIEAEGTVELERPDNNVLGHILEARGRNEQS